MWMCDFLSHLLNVVIHFRSESYILHCNVAPSNESIKLPTNPAAVALKSKVKIKAADEGQLRSKRMNGIVDKPISKPPTAETVKPHIEQPP